MKTVGDLGKIVSGPRWKQKDYVDLLSLLFLLTKTMKSKGLIALEQHIENPHDSTIFKRFPRIAKDHTTPSSDQPQAPRNVTRQNGV